MLNIDTITDVTDDEVVRLGTCFVSPQAAQLHIWGVLLGAHIGAVGYVPDDEFTTLPHEVRASVRELLECRIWWRDGAGYRIDPDHAVRTIRDSLDRLNDPVRCVATGSTHVPGAGTTCLRCGAVNV